MGMERISIEELKSLAKKYRLHPCRIAGTDVVSIRKHASARYEDIEWDEFESILKKRKLAVYKARDSDFLKIMKDSRRSR